MYDGNKIIHIIMLHSNIFSIYASCKGHTLPYDALPSFDFPRDEVEVDLYQIRKQSADATTANAGKKQLFKFFPTGHPR